jgi:hypothetical protein
MNKKLAAKKTHPRPQKYRALYEAAQNIIKNAATDSPVFKELSPTQRAVVRTCLLGKDCDGKPVPTILDEQALSLEGYESKVFKSHSVNRERLRGNLVKAANIIMAYGKSPDA